MGKMTKETTNNKYIYNLEPSRKQEWYRPEAWGYIQDIDTNFKTFSYKDDDIIVCSYPRSGTHLTWMLVRYLLQGNTDPIKDAMEDSHLPSLNKTNQQTGRRVLNTHYLPAQFGDDFFMKGKHKFINVSRNPKDALVSFYNIMDLPRKIMVDIPVTWNDFIPFVLTTDIKRFNWIHHMRAWEEFEDKNPGAPILNLKFEEILRDPKTAIKTIATFLEVPLSDKLLEDMLIASKFENMKDAPVSDVVKEATAGDAKKFTYYRKGKIGDWVNTFTVAQNELFDSAYKEQMEGSKVTNIYH